MLVFKHPWALTDTTVNKGQSAVIKLNSIDQ